jgi:hypothetical protein
VEKLTISLGKFIDEGHDYETAKAPFSGSAARCAQAFSSVNAIAGACRICYKK